MRHDQIRQPADHIRGNPELGKTVFQRLDSRQIFKHPCGNISEHDMVMRTAAVPVFPECRSPFADPVSPAGKLLLRDQAESVLRIAIVGEHTRHIFRAENAEVRLVSVRRDFRSKQVRNLLLLAFRSKPK